MDDQEKKIRQLTQEVAKWKNRALEAAEKACFECERLDADCGKCRMQQIREEAAIWYEKR